MSRGAADRGRPWQHRLDRVVGIPLVWALGRLRRRRRCPPRRVRRLGLLQLNAIGDTILCTPLVQALGRAYPDAEIVLAHGSTNAEAAALLPAVDRRLPLSVARPDRAIARLRRERLDVLIDLGPWPRISALLALGSGARFVIGFRTPGQARHGGFDRAVPHSSRRHEWRNIAALGAALGVRVAGPPRLGEQTTAPLPPLPRAPFVVLHPWAGGLRHTWKEWPGARWVALGRWLRARGYALVVSGGPGDRARSDALAARLRGEGDGERVQVLAGEASLASMTRVLVRAAALVTVNTGIMHLGAALDIPLVALHGPTRVSRWGPLGTRSVALASRTPGCPYLHLGFEYGGRRSDCMEGIALETVTGALEGLLPRRGG
ncbi:MAG: glycosyltransferase family 9 protein [Planctomycetota bacterium]|nr:MAG: glycosyltransferase family 9 protein [Planctomycetota bacterium]